ncbi:MAG: chloride channel protein [Thermodesulfobacteriota bacterium]|nr:chloride channel protein [Thermodesulfobacteriota bacterium]
MSSDNITPEQTVHRSLRSSVSEIYLSSDIARYVMQIFLAVIIGVIAGFGAILFHHVVEAMRLFFDPDHLQALLSVGFNPIFLVPVLGGVIVAGATFFFPVIAKEKGVESVIKALIIRNGYIPLKNTLFHMTTAILSIGTGAPLGPEGPVAKIGSGIGSSFSQWLSLNRKNMKIYTAAGAGAAISAVFNAPIAGVFFGIEVILLNDLRNEALSFLIIASVVGDILARALLGNETIFSIPDYALIHFTDYPWFLLLAVFCGMLTITYFGISKFVKNLFDNVLQWQNPFLRLLPVSLVFGFVLLYFDELYGIGYTTMNQVLNHEFTLATVMILLLLRILFLALFVYAGAYGGKFAPAMAIGVMFGYGFAAGTNYLFGTSLDPAAFAVVGMGGMLAGINSIPLTAMLLVFELTRDYRIILPLMLASIISYLVVIYVYKRTVYAHALLKEGIDVNVMGEVDILGKIKVAELMVKDVETVSYRMPFQKLLQRLLHSAYGEVCVVDDEDRLMGVISLKAVRQALISHELVDLLIAGDLVMPIPTIIESDPVSKALKNIEALDIENIPVTNSADDTTITGILRYPDILQAYNTLLEEWETDRFLANYTYLK